MTKRQLDELLQISYKNGDFDEVTVKQIADRMNRTMLKMYITGLKKIENKKIIYVTTPKPLTSIDREKISELFPKKKIIEQIDPAMLGGIKIIENDEAYDIDLNRIFHDIIRFVSNND